MSEKSIVTTYDKTTLWVSEKALALYQKAEYWKNFTEIKVYDPSGTVGDKLFVVAGIGYELISKEDKTVGIAHIDTLTYKGEILARPTVDYAGETFNVIAVQPGAFKNSTELVQCELPSSVASIGNEAFSGCTGLKYLVSKADKVPALGENAFTNVKFAESKLFVPRASAETYKAADQWKDFTNLSIIIDEVTVDGLTYKCNNIVESTLDFTAAKGAKGELVIPDVVNVDNYPFTVTAIAGNSFYNTDITALTLPKTLKKIMGNAFFSLGEYDNPIKKIVVPEGVTSIGANAFYGCYVKSVELPEHSLTDLAGSAFYACDIDGIKIPGSVGVIQPSTFYGCDLTWVILGEGITEIKESAFFGTKLGAVRLPSTMKKLGAAFSACSVLSSLTINDGLEYVDPAAFSNCNSLYKIFNFSKTMPEGLEAALADTGEMLKLDRTTYTVSDIMKTGNVFGTVYLRPDLDTWFDYKGIRYLPTESNSTDVLAVDASYLMEDTKVELPAEFSVNGKNYNVTDVSTYLLCGQSIMTEADITYPLAEVPSGFAYNARNLKNITLPSSVKALNGYCFAMTDSLEKVDLPENLTNIGLAAFYYSGIRELTVPSKVNLMDNASVSGCRRLEKVTFADGTGEILLGFMPTMFGNRPLFTGSKLSEATIGRNLNYLADASYGYSPFCGDSIIQRVTFTDAVTKINNHLLRDCKSIKVVKAGNKVGTIGTNVFNGCLALDSIGLGSSVRSIGSNAFAKCTGLTKFYCEAAVPPTCGSNALADIDKQHCTLYVWTNVVDKYKEAVQWKDFFNIEGYAFSGVETIANDNDGRIVVFNINGVLLLDTTDASLFDTLPAGIYIVNGKKVLKH